MVYTPPEFARAWVLHARCVAQLSQALLDGGRQFITLFTDLANPTQTRFIRQSGISRWVITWSITSVKKR
jgi:predicted GNAT family acetyltransferase